MADNTEDEQDQDENSGDESSLLDADQGLATNPLESLPPEVLQAVSVTMQSQYSGPIPPPQVLKGYEEAIPGSGDRILSMAEKEQDHRHMMEKNFMVVSRNAEYAGIILGFTLALTTIIGGFLVILNGFEVTGIAAIGGAAAILAVVYLRQSGNQGNNQDDKQPELPETTDEAPKTPDK